MNPHSNRTNGAVAHDNAGTQRSIQELLERVEQLRASGDSPQPATVAEIKRLLTLRESLNDQYHQSVKDLFGLPADAAAEIRRAVDIRLRDAQLDLRWNFGQIECEVRALQTEITQEASESVAAFLKGVDRVTDWVLLQYMAPPRCDHIASEKVVVVGQTTLTMTPSARTKFTPAPVVPARPPAVYWLVERLRALMPAGSFRRHVETILPPELEEYDRARTAGRIWCARGIAVRLVLMLLFPAPVRHFLDVVLKLAQVLKLFN